MVRRVYDTYSIEWPPSTLGAAKSVNFLGTEDLRRIRFRTDLERSWTKFLAWIGFQELSKARARKQGSINQILPLQTIASHVFSVEIGLSRILKRWVTLRKLRYPEDDCTYNAYAFIDSCVAIKRNLRNSAVDSLRSRIIAELLPSGRLSGIDHEFRIARFLKNAEWRVSKLGILGEPGPDFVAVRKQFEIEIEGKCISSETGLGVTYGFAGALLNAVSDRIGGRYFNKFVTIVVEVKKPQNGLSAIPCFRDQIEQTYRSGADIETNELKTRISMRPLEELIAEFGPFGEESNFRELFNKIRRQPGDFGLFTGDRTECVFVNLVPMTPSKEIKKIMRIISETCEKQFSKRLPAVLWLHLQGLDPYRLAPEGIEKGTRTVLDNLARHAFGDPRRGHLSYLIFSSDTYLVARRALGQTRWVRAVDGNDETRCYRNPRSWYGNIEGLTK
jgi:hypothetical protein